MRPRLRLKIQLRSLPGIGMKLILIASIVLLSGYILASGSTAASSEAAPESGAAHGLNPLVLISIAAILVIAKLAGELFERFNQPAVLGELIGGIIIGSLPLLVIAAVNAFTSLETSASGRCRSQVSSDR